MLAVIGGVDRNLRVGGRCMDRQTAKQGTILGVNKEGSKNVKVQWDDGDTFVRYVSSFINVRIGVKILDSLSYFSSGT